MRALCLTSRSEHPHQASCPNRVALRSVFEGEALIVGRHEVKVKTGPSNSAHCKNLF